MSVVYSQNVDTNTILGTNEPIQGNYDNIMKTKPSKRTPLPAVDQREILIDQKNNEVKRGRKAVNKKLVEEPKKATVVMVDKHKRVSMNDIKDSTSFSVQSGERSKPFGSEVDPIIPWNNQITEVVPKVRKQRVSMETIMSEKNTFRSGFQEPLGKQILRGVDTMMLQGNTDAVVGKQKNQGYTALNYGYSGLQKERLGTN